MQKDAEIFDLDGTLCNVTSIRHHVLKKHKDFKSFHSESVNCPPNEEVVRAARQAKENGRAVLVVTARSFDYVFHSMFWLNINDVPYDQIYMRAANDYRPDHEVKKDILDMIKADGYHPVGAWDDRAEIAEVWESAGIPTTIVEGYGFD